ncbi:MAG: hypothetical protein J07HN4v3_01728, partial [Halonotius sp. J07HN4]
SSSEPLLEDRSLLMILLAIFSHPVEEKTPS